MRRVDELTSSRSALSSPQGLAECQVEGERVRSCIYLRLWFVAGYEVPQLGLDHSRHFPGADLAPSRAPRMKRAPTWRVDLARHLSLKVDAGALLVGVCEVLCRGYDLVKTAERVAVICNIDMEDIFSKGKQKNKVRARSLLCYWASRVA